jgi:hypothetical protein
MQSKDLHQMKAAIRDQAFLGNARVFCIMGPVVAARQRLGQLLAMIRGWGRWYPVERVRIEYAGRQLLSSRSWPDERAFATTPVRSWGKFRLLKERYSPSQPIYGRTGRIDRKLPRVCRDRDPLCTRPDRATQRKLLCTNTQNHWPTTVYARRDAPRACPV